MFHEFSDKRGSVLALVLMVMVTIMIIGITAMHDTEIEGRVSRNYAIYKDTFYRADAAAREAVQLLENAANPSVQLQPSSGSCLSFIQNVGFDVKNNGSAVAVNSSLVPNNAQYLVVYEGIAPESELGMEEETHLYAYTAYGAGSYSLGSDNSMCIVQIGYRRRY